MVEVGGGGGAPPTCPCPSHFCQVGSRLLHPRRREEGDTQPLSSTSLADKCHLHHLLQRARLRSGGSAAWQRGARTVSPQEEAQPLQSRDTDTGSCGDREGVAIGGVEQCMREGSGMLMGSRYLLWGGVGGRQLGDGGQAPPGGHNNPYSLSTPMAVPLVARRWPQLPARVGEGRIQHPLGERSCEPPATGYAARMSTPRPPDSGAFPSGPPHLPDATHPLQPGVPTPTQLPAHPLSPPSTLARR